LKILLTGANGFTGQFFKAQAASAGHEVVPLLADLTKREALQHEVLQSAPDAVVHLAAISFVGHANDNAFYAVNVIGTTNLLAALAALPKRPRQVLLASSANIYGNCEKSPITEDQPPSPVNHYAVSKLAMEHMARTYEDRLPLVIARPFNYTGPAQSTDFLIPKLVAHFERGDANIELGNLNVEREFNDVHMVCDAYLQLLEYGVAGEVYNVCSGRPYTLQFVITELARLTGHSIKVDVNLDLVRANDLHCLYGCPAKLDAALASHGVKLKRPSLADTLRNMLQASAAKTQASM
jgi:GDP-6-deoxy-D-talose 4-dehydrogenase